MKKIFTLLVCTAILSSVFAQQDQRNWSYSDGNNNFYNNDYRWQRNPVQNYENNYFVYQNNRYGFAERNTVIQRILYAYEQQVERVVQDCNLSPFEKRCYIRQIQAQRAQDINDIYAQCNHPAVIFQYYRRHRHHDDDDDD